MVSFVVCSCRKPSWTWTPTQLWGMIAADLFSQLTFLNHSDYDSNFHQVTLVAICRRWGGSSSRAAGEEIFNIFC